jgi:hypothetical protein
MYAIAQFYTFSNTLMQSYTQFGDCIDLVWSCITIQDIPFTFDTMPYTVLTDNSCFGSATVKAPNSVFHTTFVYTIHVTKPNYIKLYKLNGILVHLTVTLV